MKKLLLIIFGLVAALIANAQSKNFEQAVKAIEAKDLTSALDYLSKDLKENTNSALSYLYRGFIYNNQENNSAALTDVNNAIKYAAEDEKKLLASAYSLRAMIYKTIDDLPRSLKDYSTAITYNPEDADIYIDRAQVFYILDQFDQAEEDYRQVLKIDEGDVRAWAGLGRNYYAQKKFDDAEKILNQLTNLSPDYASGFYYKSKVFYSQKKFNDAILNIFEALSSKGAPDDSRKLFIGYAEKNYPLAFSKVNSAILAKPDNDFWIFIHARLSEEKGDQESAIADYTKILEFAEAEDKPDLLNFRGQCYSDAGMYEQAISDFNESLAVDSTNAYLYGHRGNSQRLLGNYSNAIKDLTVAIQLKPQEPWFYYMRGWIYEEFQKDNVAGLKDYNTAISIDPEYAYTYVHRGRMYASKLNEPAKAKADYLKILSLDTTINKQSNCRQYALMELGRNLEAETWMKKIIEAYPTEGNYYDASCLYAKMNKPLEAIASLKLAFENGYRAFKHLAADDDLDNIRNLPEFKKIVKIWEIKFETAKMKMKSPVSKEINKPTKSISNPMTSYGERVCEIKSNSYEISRDKILDAGFIAVILLQTAMNLY